MDSFQPGAEVSHFRLIEKIGTGATGEVFRAEDILLGRTVALKIVRLNDPLQKERFLDVSLELDRIMQKCLAASPGIRYSCAAESLQDLERLKPIEERAPSGIRYFIADPLSIAVLYFECVGDQQEGKYLRLGITEDIITDLSKIAGLRVLSRHAVQKYKDKTPDKSAVARDLQVRFLLDGTVQKLEERLLAKAQLWDEQSQNIVWKQSYDGQLNDIFDVQEEVAGTISAALQIRLTESERRSIHTRSTANSKAYELFLRGRQLYDQANISDNRLAEQMLLRAIELDPRFTAAYAGLAEVYVQRFYNWFDRNRRWLQKAEEAAGQAQQIDDRLSEVHCTSGMLAYLRGDYEKAMVEIQKAIRLDPHYAAAHDHTGEIYLHTGDAEMQNFANAARYAQKAIEQIDPFDHHAEFDRACVHALAGESDAAFAWLNKAIDLGWRCRSHFQTERNLSGIRKDPEFTEILKRL